LIEGEEAFPRYGISGKKRKRGKIKPSSSRGSLGWETGQMERNGEEIGSGGLKTFKALANMQSPGNLRCLGWLRGRGGKNHGERGGGIG